MPPTKPFIVSTTNPYNISGRCLNKEWFAIPLETVWKIFSEYLYFISHAYKIRIHSFVLMGNHFHLICSSPTGEISQAMQFFMSQTSRTLAKESGRINHIWGSRFHRCEITSYHYYLNCYKYNYRNPVTAGIVKNVEDYPFSTLYGLLGQTHLVIPVEEDLTLFSAVEDALKWLNQTPSKENLNSVRLALKRTKFKLSPINARENPLEINTL